MGKRIHVVIWSGGMDSTLVLDKVCSANLDSCIWAYTINWNMLNELKVKKEKEPEIPKIKGIDGSKENSALLKTDILKTIQMLTPPEYDNRVETDQAYKKDNQVKATGDEDEIIIFRDENGRLMG